MFKQGERAEATSAGSCAFFFRTTLRAEVLIYRPCLRHLSLHSASFVCTYMYLPFFPSCFFFFFLVLFLLFFIYGVISDGVSMKDECLGFDARVIGRSSYQALFKPSIWRIVKRHLVIYLWCYFFFLFNNYALVYLRIQVNFFGMFNLFFFFDINDLWILVKFHCLIIAKGSRKIKFTTLYRSIDILRIKFNFLIWEVKSS